jgi:hypothetical protein
MLVLVLTDLVGYFNVGKQMNAGQVIATAEIIETEYWHLNLADLKYCFVQVKAGKIGGGKMYDAIDGAKICGWIDEYCDLRRPKLKEIADQKKTEKLQEIIDFQEQALTHPIVAGAYKKLLEKHEKQEESFKAFCQEYNKSKKEKE